MVHCHSAGGDRNIHVFDAGHPPHGSVDLAGATGAIHAFDAIAGLNGG
jgi:hypothetical protein